MAHQLNPIQGKLSKMRTSQMLRCHTQIDNTPLKTYQISHHQDKQNISEYPLLTQQTKQSVIKHAENSVRKIGLLERKSIKKEQSIQFYRGELNRRKQKYQEQLQKNQEELECQLNSLEAELIKKMKQQQEMDEQSEILRNISHLLSNQQNIQEYSMLENLSDQALTLLQQKLTAFGIVGTQLLYSKETLLQSMRYNKLKDTNQIHIPHTDVQFVSSNRKNTEEDSIDYHAYSPSTNSQIQKIGSKEMSRKARHQFVY